MSQAYYDLEWALKSPSMMGPSADWHLAQNPHGFELNHWLSEVKANPAPLESYLSEVQANRLGLYYEYLLKYFFEHYPSYTLLMHNFPVYQEKRTMGAFDFIYKNDQNQIIHRECAVKFYLGIPNGMHESSSSWSSWWGPNKADRLDKKLNRLTSHQIVLGETPEAQALLSRKHLSIDIKEIDLKGYLCYPLNKVMAQPKGVNPNHNRAFWLSEQEIDALPQRQYWDMLDRMRWLSPVHHEHKPPLTTSKLKGTLKNHFKHTHAPVLIAQLNKQSTGYHEINRYFITPNDWQNREGKDD